MGFGDFLACDESDSGMMPCMPSSERLPDIAAAVARILAVTGGHPRVAPPLGLGKPHDLLNALYAEVAERTKPSLTIFSTLSLTRPRANPGLEARFLDPFLDRHLGLDFQGLDYAAAQARDALPPNVHVHEFYLQSGPLLHSAPAQRDYISQNYTHVARDLVGRQINVLVQLVAASGERISLSTNPDLTFDFLDRQAAAGQPRALCVAVVHPDLPFVSGNAEAPAGFFDVVVMPEKAPSLFALPRQPVTVTEHALGIHASALVRDGGCLEIGIGALSDAIVHALLLRHGQNAPWNEALQALDGRGVTRSMALREGGTAPFERGIYGASEMVMDGFMHLERGGVLKRRTFDDMDRERRSARGETDADPRRGGHYLRGAFVLGSRELYRWLHQREAEDPDGIDLCRVSNVNQLYGDHQALAALQRRDARFFNTCMMATLLGSAVSDGLEDGHVVSGVGGQYNFVAMAHELPEGRSILLLRSTRRVRGTVQSNIRWNYGHTTIPRHLRDIFVTEYGVADLRGKTDSECIEAMLALTDARFLDALCAEAKSNGKLAADFQVPEKWRRNTPENLREALEPLRRKGLLPDFPFGSDFTEVERQLLGALSWLKSSSGSLRGKWSLLRSALRPGEFMPGEDEALQRMDLADPHGLGFKGRL